MTDYAKLYVTIEESDNEDFSPIIKRRAIDAYSVTTINTMHLINKLFKAGDTYEVEFEQWNSVELLIIKNLNKDRYIDLVVPTSSGSQTENRLDADGIFITTDFDVSVGSGLLRGTPESGYDVNCEIIAFGT